MDYIPDFIDRKHGRKPIEYDIPVMEKYLKDTYGITVYQEQVMLLSRLLADFTRGESDALRKAMGKKLIEKMNHLKSESSRKDLDGLGKVCVVCFQQVSCYLLFMGGLSDCLSESELSFRIYGGCNEPKFVEHYGYHEADG